MYGNYLINVPYVYTKTISYGGAKIVYKHPKDRYRDVLEISGSTTETLKVVVLFRSEIILILMFHNSRYICPPTNERKII